MDVITGFFYLFSTILLLSAFMVVTARNPVHSALYMILAFSQASGLWFLLRAEFVAIVLILVYLGAVMVLFLFVVMMLDNNRATARRGYWKNFPLTLLIGVIVGGEMALVLLKGFPQMNLPVPPHEVFNAAGELVQYSNTRELGILMFTEYLYPVQIAGATLLVGMIAAIGLTLRGRKDSKYQNPGQQVLIHPEERMEIVKMTATRASAVAQDEEKEAQS